MDRNHGRWCCNDTAGDVEMWAGFPSGVTWLRQALIAFSVNTQRQNLSARATTTSFEVRQIKSLSSWVWTQSKSAGAAVKVHKPSEDHWLIVSPVSFSGQTQISRFPARNNLPHPPLPQPLLHLMVSDLIAFIDLAALLRQPDQLTGQKFPVMK